MNKLLSAYSVPPLDSFYQELPSLLEKIRASSEELDQNFPIREGQSNVDRILLSEGKELTFVWVKRECSLDFISQMILDYDWIQRNRPLFHHLFGSQFDVSLWKIHLVLFSLEIRPEVKSFLSYLNPIPLDLYQCASTPQGFKIEWMLQDMEEVEVKALEKPTIPVSHSFEPIPVNQEEIQDLLSYQPGTEFWSADEVTEPFLDLASFQEE